MSNSMSDLNEVKVDSNLENIYNEFFGDSSWRILPLDTKPENKFVADMVFDSLDSGMFEGHTVAHGYIYNDSRGIFRDGDPVRTSTVKQIVEIDGQQYIETRNTMYRLIERPKTVKVEIPNV